MHVRCREESANLKEPQVEEGAWAKGGEADCGWSLAESGRASAIASRNEMSGWARMRTKSVWAGQGAGGTVPKRR